MTEKLILFQIRYAAVVQPIDEGSYELFDVREMVS